MTIERYERERNGEKWNWVILCVWERERGVERHSDRRRERASSHGGWDSGSLPGMPLHCHLWAAFVHVWGPAYPMILDYYPDPTLSMRPPALSCLFLLRDLLPPTPFPLACSISSLHYNPPNSLSPHFTPSFLYLSPLTLSQSTARCWASATSMKTDDSVLFFFLLPHCRRPPSRRGLSA